jgi:hypothetical protein
MYQTRRRAKGKLARKVVGRRFVIHNTVLPQLEMDSRCEKITTRLRRQ